MGQTNHVFWVLKLRELKPYIPRFTLSKAPEFVRIFPFGRYFANIGNFAF